MRVNGKIKKYFMMLLALIMVVSMLAGCGSKNETDTPGTGGNGKPAATADPTEGPKEPKVFVYGMGSDPETIDPQINSGGDGMTINSNLFEGLVVTDADLTSKPGVAESWSISDDGLVYTFNLRKDAKWSDGSPITTADFVYSWTRVLNPELGAKYSSQMFYIKNGEAIFKGEMDISEFGIEAVDEHTFKVTLEAPTQYMLQLFARGVFAPVKKDVVEANPDTWTKNAETCIGNGPFILKDYSVNEHFVLVKDENYWNADAIKVDEIKFVFIADSNTSLAAFNAGEIDGTTNIPSAEKPILMQQSDEFNIRTRLSTRYMIFNNQHEILSNVKVREALSKAIDRQLIVDNVTMSGETPAAGFVPPGMIVEGKDFNETAGDYGIKPSAMVEEAQAALAAAGYPNGEGFPELEFMYADTDLYKRMAEVLQEMWKKNLNIDIKLSAIESKVYKSRRTEHDFEITISGWSADYSYPLTFIDMWIQGARTNYADYQNDEFDAIIRDIRNTADPAKSAELLYEAEEMFIGRDFIISPLYYNVSTILMKDYTSGWYTNALGKHYFMYTDINK